MEGIFSAADKYAAQAGRGCKSVWLLNQGRSRSERRGLLVSHVQTYDVVRRLNSDAAFVCGAGLSTDCNVARVHI